MSRLADILQARQGECADCPPAGADHFGATGNGVSDRPWDGAASRFTDAEYKRAAAACDPGDGTVKERCFLPHHEPDGTTNRNGVHAAAQRVSALRGHDAGAVARAKAHLRSHYRELKEDPPDVLKASGGVCGPVDTELTPEEHAAAHAEMQAVFGHDPIDGKHTHPHPAYGAQGGDDTHEHEHTHHGDADHGHHTAETAAAHTALSFRRSADGESWTLLADGTGGDPMLGAAWAIVQDGTGFRVLTAGGRPWSGEAAATYTEALAAIAEQLATAADTRPVLDQGWRSDMAFEGRSTGDGRYIEPGATNFRPVPLPLMLQTETEGGHIGAVLCGSILKAGMIGPVADGGGNFDATDAGSQALQILQARDRFGVSIDVAEAEGHPVCATHGADLDDCDFGCPIEAHFTTIRVMGLTMTPFPAFEDAYIQLSDANGNGTAPGAEADTGRLALAVDNLLDIAGPKAAALTQAGNVTDDHACAGLALTVSAGVMSDEVLNLLGVDDPDGDSPDHGDPGDPAGPRTAAEALGATIAAAGWHFGQCDIGDGDPVSEVAELVSQAAAACDMLLASFGTQASAAPPCTDCAGHDGPTLIVVAAGTAPGADPPAAWFEDPQFGAESSDSRLYRQPDGQTLCPLTIEAPDPDHGGLRRVYGHLAGWRSCHTGYGTRCVTPPRSRTGYAAVNLRPVMTAEGDPVNAGHLSMGCGHAAATGMSVQDVRDHYDGGPGAITMAYVRYGEDDHGPWFAGYVNPAATDEQIAAFGACSVSGDWREVWRGKGLELVACLAGVKVPGFTITRQLAAAGLALSDADHPIPDEPIAVYDTEGTVVALVAAGAVRQPYPWEKALGTLTAAHTALQARLEAAETDLDDLQSDVAYLRPLIAERMVASLTPPGE